MSVLQSNFLNLLSAKSDKHQFSHNIISAQSGEEVMRIDEMITEGKNTVVIFQILPTSYVWKCIEISLENLYADIRT